MYMYLYVEVYFVKGVTGGHRKRVCRVESVLLLGVGRRFSPPRFGIWNKTSGKYYKHFGMFAYVSGVVRLWSCSCRVHTYKYKIIHHYTILYYTV